MGSSSSKVSRAAGAAARQYPTRSSSFPDLTNPTPPPQPPPHSANARPGPTVHPQVQATSSRSEAINLDASDPHFARSLRSIGPVQPNPTLSQTSTFPSPGNPNSIGRRIGPDPRQNPAIAILEARARLQDEAEKEFMEAGRRGHSGRQFLDVYTIRQMLVLRDERRQSPEQIEKALGLMKGTVERLGPVGVAGLSQEVGRAQKGINFV